VSFETVLQLISATTTRTGLQIKARLDKGVYATGIEIADEEMERLNLRLHEKNPQWNYSLSPSESEDSER
jgi:hypothetical protein